MKKSLLAIFLLNLVLLVAPTASAADIWEMAESDQYKTKVGGMLGRGLVNAASCFVDIFVHTVRETQDGPPLVGTLTGLGSGAACTVLRAGSGILDVASFWVPGFNGIPVNRSYENCLLEETSGYSGSNFQSNSSAGNIGTSYNASAPVRSVKTPTQRSTSQNTQAAHDPSQYVKK